MINKKPSFISSFRPVWDRQRARQNLSLNSSKHLAIWY